MNKRDTLAGGLAVAAALVATPATANERHFGYTYESATLPEGGMELELWTTNRVGREERYNRFDNRLEFELGITDRLQTAFYLNTTGLIEGSGEDTNSEFEFDGVSSEWKGKLSDATADAVGSALYGEVTYTPGELEIEAKVILDKHAGPVLFAANVVGELEIGDLGGEDELEGIVEVDLGLAYALAPEVSLGVELRNHTVMKGAELEGSAFFVGPVVAWSMERAWATLSVLGQIGAIKHEEPADGATTDSAEGPLVFARDLAEHEAVNARLLLGFHL